MMICMIYHQESQEGNFCFADNEVDCCVNRKQIIRCADSERMCRDNKLTSSGTNMNVEWEG